jgi:serine/threonine protein phosphatase 1
LDALPVNEVEERHMSLTYAVGDIHGALHKLESIVAQCRAHPGHRGGGGAPKFVFVGDYIDRGPHSRGVIRYLIELAQEMPDNVVTLMGNHEAMLIAIIDGAIDPEDWLGQGGRQTLQSYGVTVARDLPREHVDWLRRLRFSYDDGRRFFVHAGVDPARPLDAQNEHDLLWIREPFLSYRGDYGRLVVHGHTPIAAGVPELRGNRLGLDTGAGYGRPLTAAVFSDAMTPPLGFLTAA